MTMNRWWKAWGRSLRWLFVLLGLLGALWLAPAYGQAGDAEPVPEGNLVDGFAVELDGATLFYVREGIPGVVSAQERAIIIAERVREIADDPDIAPKDVQVENREQDAIVRAGDVVLFTVRPEDTRSPEQTFEAAAQLAADRIQTALVDYQAARSTRRLVLGGVYAILSTLALIVFLRVVQRAIARLINWIIAISQRGFLGLRLPQMQVVSSRATGYLLRSLVRLLQLILTLFAFYLYFPFVLSQFPFTRVVGGRLFAEVLGTLQTIAASFAEYLPNLVILFVIGYVTTSVLGLAKLIIHELGRDESCPWFYDEWVEPTIRLATFTIIAFALVIAGPYLPGFGSPSFQGISLFVGALFTLGSSTAVANAIAGLILIYTRAFRLGDVVRVNGILGVVDEKSLFVTRVRTFKQEVTTIPNSSLLNNEVTNLSVIARETERGLVLHTTITLGYDVPWRKVHQVLIEAAIATHHILQEPPPFVLQTSLNDFNVSYELNASTRTPAKIPAIYDQLHQNIQDFCNAADIEILSPTFSALRDGNHSTIPTEYLPDDYEPPGFQVRTKLK
jgi:small-conductance mechanosensitive channel